jgi:hypothetical protein
MLPTQIERPKTPNEAASPASPGTTSKSLVTIMLMNFTVRNPKGGKTSNVKRKGTTASMMLLRLT